MILGTGGICLWAYLRSMEKHKSIPLRDPRILESINAHE